MKGTLTGASVAALGALLMLAAQPAESKTTAKSPESVTLTGCLHADGGKYMLTDLKGDQAPKGRSWKTAFIVVDGAVARRFRDPLVHGDRHTQEDCRN